MAADLTTVTSRTTEILNVVAPGTYSSTVASTNLDRNSTAISEAVREAALEIARVICSNPRHPHRGVFVSGTPIALTHGGEVPDMSGEGDAIQIQRYSGASFTIGTPRNAQQIESYRLNPSGLYGSLAHDTQNSPLSGYYAIQNGRIYFTGNAAQIYTPVINRTTVTGLIPDECEGVWVALSVFLCMKEGDNLQPVAQAYAAFAQNALAQIANLGDVPVLPAQLKAEHARRDN